MSAASLATSVADSTEMPTSAACRATASFTPSPMNATSTPVRRATLMMRAFWSGLTRAKTVVSGMAPARASSSRSSISVPVRTPRLWRRMSRHTFEATRPLSPVITFTSMPIRSSVATEAAASTLGTSTNVRKPQRSRSFSSAASIAVAPGAARRATATTRAPSAKSRSTVAWARGGTAAQRDSTTSGAPLVISVAAPSPSATSTEASWRSWSNGRAAMRWRSLPASAWAAPGAAQRATSRGLPA